MFTPTNPGFQTPNSTNTSAANWSATRSDTTGYPATALWWQNWGTAAGRDNASEGSNAHYAYSLSNLAYGWLESNYIAGLQAGQPYDLAVDLRGALDPTNTQGVWLVRAAFYNNSSQAVGAPVVAVQGNGATLARFTDQRVTGRVTVPTGATKVKLQLVSQLTSGWLAFDNVAFTLVGSPANLAPSPGFEDPAAGQTLGWSEVRSAAHPGTGFQRTDRMSPWAAGFASKAYVISNLTGGWLESDDIPVTAGQGYTFSVYYRGEVDLAQSDVSFYGGRELCGVFLQYYDSAGQPVFGEGKFDCNTQRVWQRYALSTTPPPGAVKARIWLTSYSVAGWVAFDDVEFKASNSATNLVTNGNFESGTNNWTKKWTLTASNAQAYPATGFTRDSAGIGAGRNGSYGYALSNLATGYLEATAVAVAPGKKYQISAWLRGQLNDRAGQGDWRIRAQFYSSTSADLGYQNGCYGYGENTLTWHLVKCYVVAPPGAATMRLQVWLVQHSGWVAVDDFTIDDLTVTGWDGVTKYYLFNGQRVALRGATGLVYLHTDHLGSTKLVTDRDGNPVQAPTQYYAYGREQTLGSVAGLPTDYTFTGQRQDNTGLLYMNARYYDPELGQFLSPDTLTPDPSNVFDYNRYMYALGNPLKHNDPSGHCVDGISTAICIGAAVGFVAGAGLYLWNESHQADGIDLSVNVSWQNGTPSVDLHDWGDFMTAGVSGAAVGAMIPIGGAAAAIGTGAGGNLLADHMHNLLSGDDFSALNHTWTGVTGAATSIATLGANALVEPLATTGSTLLNQVIKTGAKGVTAGIMDGFASNIQEYANTGKSNLANNLGGNILWDIGAEAFSSQIGGINPGWVEGDWNLAKDEGDALWNAGLSFAWKYMETPMRTWLDQAQQVPSTGH